MNVSIKTSSITVGHLGELLLEVTNARIETVTVSHFDSKELVVVLLDFSTGGVLGKEHFSYLLKGSECGIKE